MVIMEHCVTCHAVIDVLVIHVIEIHQHVPQKDASLDIMVNIVTRHAMNSARTTSVTEIMESAWVVRMDIMGKCVTRNA